MPIAAQSDVTLQASPIFFGAAEHVPFEHVCPIPQAWQAFPFFPQTAVVVPVVQPLVPQQPVQLAGLHTGGTQTPAPLQKLLNGHCAHRLPAVPQREADCIE